MQGDDQGVAEEEQQQRDAAGEAQKYVAERLHGVKVSPTPGMGKDKKSP